MSTRTEYNFADFGDVFTQKTHNVIARESHCAYENIRLARDIILTVASAKKSQFV